jgi:hypothetical protein
LPQAFAKTHFRHARRVRVIQVITGTLSGFRKQLVDVDTDKRGRYIRRGASDAMLNSRRKTAAHGTVPVKMQNQLGKDRRDRFRRCRLRRIDPVTPGDKLAGYRIDNRAFNT